MGLVRFLFALLLCVVTACGLCQVEPPPYESTGNSVKIVDILERKYSNTYQLQEVGESLVPTLVNSRHTVGIQFKSFSWSYSGPTPPPNVKSITQVTSLWVAQGTELGVPTGVTVMTGTYASEELMGAAAPSGESILVQTSDTGEIESGRTLRFWIRTTTTTTYNDSTPPNVHDYWVPFEYDLIKLECEDASVDTRRAYGQPNKAGSLPGDANAQLRHVRFGSSEYNGGIFLGHMPSNSKDASGTARAQFFVQGGEEYENNYIFASLSLFDKGKPADSAVSGAILAGIYFPDDEDPNLETTEGALRWSNAWAITPEEFNDASTDYTTNPLFERTLTNGNSDDYVSFPLTPLNARPKPEMALRYICLAMVGEETIASGISKFWHYFASQEYEKSAEAFPRNDCAPRVWLIVLSEEE